MNWLKLANIVGIGLQILGVCVLAGSDLLARRTEAAYESIPGNPLVDAFETALNDETRIVTPEESTYQRLQAKGGARNALRTLRASLLFVVAGMVFQLIAAVCG